MIPRTTAVCTLAAIAFAASLADAQQPAAPPMPVVPVSTCAKPDLPGAFADSRRFERFNKEAKAYGECIKKFVEETKALSDAALESGNKAIKEYNAFVADVDERSAAKK